MNKTNNVIAIDLALRSTGIVVFEGGKFKQRLRVEIDKKLKLEKDTRAIAEVIQTELKKLDIDLDQEYEVVIELSKANWKFPCLAGMYSFALQYLYKINKFNFIAASKWQHSLLGAQRYSLSKERKNLAKDFVKQHQDNEKWSSDEADAYCVGVYWLGNYGISRK